MIAYGDARFQQGRDAGLEDAKTAIASQNILGMTASSMITKLCAVIDALKGEKK